MAANMNTFAGIGCALGELSGGGQMPEGVRSALLLRTCLEVLKDAGRPLPGREVLKQVSERVELTPAEQSTVKSGTPRW
jgi:5-methylcytosine-specific restriction protein B